MLLSITVPQTEEAKEILKALMNDLKIEANHIHKGPKCYKAVLPKIAMPQQKEIIKKVMEKASSIICPNDEEATKRNLEQHSSGFVYWSKKARKLFYEHSLQNGILKALNELYAQKPEYA